MQSSNNLSRQYTLQYSAPNVSMQTSNSTVDNNPNPSDLPYPTQDQYEVSELTAYTNIAKIAQMPQVLWLEVGNNHEERQDAARLGLKWSENNEHWYYCGVEDKTEIFKDKGWYDPVGNLRLQVFVPPFKDPTSLAIREAAKENGAKFLSKRKIWYITKKDLQKHKDFWKNVQTKELGGPNTYSLEF